jgi:hypothetical protein
MRATSLFLLHVIYMRKYLADASAIQKRLTRSKLAHSQEPTGKVTPRQ